MTHTVTYGAGWHRRLGELTKELTSDEARRLHEAGEKYVALLHDGDRPVAVVEVVGQAQLVKVHFLDEERRDTGTYVFIAHPDGGNLRLEQTFIREMVDRRTVVAQDWYGFDVDGTVHRRVRTPDEPAEQVFVTHIDPAEHPELREPMPAFGDYASIARWERELPA